MLRRHERTVGNKLSVNTKRFCEIRNATPSSVIRLFLFNLKIQFKIIVTILLYENEDRRDIFI